MAWTVRWSEETVGGEEEPGELLPEDYDSSCMTTRQGNPVDDKPS